MLGGPNIFKNGNGDDENLDNGRSEAEVDNVAFDCTLMA